MVNEQTAAKVRISYRSHIEGLRAVAILLVVAAHTKVPGLSGGFIGVDVFFVISGYLISGLLVREIELSGSVDFGDFYSRRLRRLLPAWLLVWLVTCVFGMLLVEPARQPDQAAAAAAAALWISNYFFALEELSYFAPLAETNLFLHTWSLGVEEQFYLIWPLLIFVFAARTSAGRRPLLNLMFVVIALSLPASIALSYAAPNLAFYMMPARAWQFALGALVFLYSERDGSSEQSSVLREWGSALGLGAVGVAATLLDGNEHYPGAWALLPSLGTAAALTAASNSATHRLLSLKVLQWIGRRSYGWYLWHWPVLLLGATVLDTRDAFSRAALAGASLLFAAASYRWVEMPLRNSAALASQPKAVVATGLWLAIIAWLGALLWRADAEVLRERLLQAGIAVGSELAPVQNEVEACGEDWYRNGGYSFCHFGPTNSTRTAILIGDSVAAQWSPALKDIFPKAGWHLFVNSRFSCPMLDEPFFNRTIRRDYAVCAAWRRAALEAIAALRPEIVFISTIDNYPFTKEQWIQGTRRVLEAIAPHSGRVYLLRSTPILPDKVWACGVPQTRLHDVLTASDSCSAPTYSRVSDNVFTWQQAAAADFTNVTLVDLTDLVCPEGQCRVRRDSRPVFRDPVHLAPDFVRRLVPALTVRLELPKSSALLVPSEHLDLE